MGETPGEDYEISTGCPCCFSPGMAWIFGPGFLFPPKYMRATFGGITLCSPPGADPNGSYLLQHSPGSCEWESAPGTFIVTLSFCRPLETPPASYLLMFSVLPAASFFDCKSTPCELLYFNDLTVGQCSFTVKAYGGWAYISWGPDVDP